MNQKEKIDDFYRKRKKFQGPMDELILDGKYSRVMIDRSDMAEAQAWCNEHFQDNWIWSSPVYTSRSKIWFLNPEDALLFKLRFNTV